MRLVVAALCRAGFEAEAALDLLTIARREGGSIDAAPTTGTGYVTATTDLDLRRFDRALAAQPPVFIRSAFAGLGPVPLGERERAATGGSRIDRVTPLLHAIERLATEPSQAPPWRSAWIEYPDSNEGKALSTLARSLASRIDGELARRHAIDDAAARRLHVLLVDGLTAFVGTSPVGTGSRWPLGIPRLRMPGRAPSRSTLKLAEAFTSFLADEEGTLLRPGLRAVDLGAAPGGWTWQLAFRGLRVTAVDNGPLKGEVASDPLVTHLRADGLVWRPRKPVDWLVCDIAMQPSRIADLIANWVAEGFTRRAIFNLKLPMKKRYAEVVACRSRIAERLERAGIRHRLVLRQLYHDREEVTGYLTRID